jgi:glycine/D-amino acid oxidase-like deaminating enzyme/nitrite reductase/ring-hydroxylating ferredoxin subunit
MPLPGRADCCWTADAPRTDFPPYEGSGGAEIAVIGAGIVGLTAAYLLARAGRSVVVLEARRLGRQVTGRSTAKITSQHALIYRYLLDVRGIDHAKHYAEANRSGERLIYDWIRELGIACDFERKDAYTYTCDPSRRTEIEAEAQAARQMGFDADVVETVPLPFPTACALRFRDQAQFNPTQYLVGLAMAVEAAGGRIFENSVATAVNKGKEWRVKTSAGVLDAAQVVMATNYPFAGPIDYDGRARPRYHIAMAFRVPRDKAIEGMYISIDEPTHSLRMGRDQSGPLLVALGGRLQTGHDGDVAQYFRDLEHWVRANLKVGEAAYRWGNEDYDTADRVPFAGQAGKSAEGLYVATGFNGWGISNGTAAATMIADQIRGRPNLWTALYDPCRPASDEFNQGADTQSRMNSIDGIVPGQGGVIVRGKNKFAVRKNPDGTLHALSASCTHKGCVVTWNNAEQTWDCPCHGSIFSADGAVIHGPAVEPLAPAALSDVRIAASPRRARAQR